VIGNSGKQWLACAVGLAVVACTDAIAPPPPPVKVAFTVQPSNATAGVAIDPVVTVAIQDASGDLVPSATNVVTVTIGTNPGSGTLAGTASVTAVNGVATFSNLRIDRAGTGYTLTASADGLTGATSTAFAITAGSATKLVFISQPTDAIAGVAISPAIGVAIEDASGNTVTSAMDVVTLAVGTNPGGGTLTGTTGIAAVNGVATFSNLYLDKAGPGYTLTATATGLTSATSAAFAIAAAPAARLGFTVQPSDAMGGAAITPPVQVTALDPFGNVATAFQESVTVALGGNPTPGTLSGTTTVRAVGGIATFGDLSIAQVSAGYTLTASAGGLTGLSSTAFAIVKPTGSLRITAATSGAAPDPDGYAACIDPAPDGQGGTICGAGGAVPVNGSVTLTVDTGGHAVLLTGLAANCAVSGDNPRAAHNSRGETAQVAFVVACSPPALHITTATSGTSFAPAGYYVCLDPTYDYDDAEYCGPNSSPIGANSAVTVPVAPGSHVVELQGVPDNCTVGGDNPRTVEAGADVPFALTCFAIGGVRVRTATTGTDVDPDAYRVCVDRSPNDCYWRAPARANDAITISGVTAEPHTVRLTGVGGNCTVGGGTVRAVSVPPNGTVDVGFNASCVFAERIAFSYYGTITVVHADGSAAHPVAAGWAPAWSPGGSRLAFECGGDVCAIDGDGTGYARLTLDGAANQHPTWSPDGLKIAFAATHAGTTDLYVMAASGSGVVRLTKNVGFLGSPAWSPDGTRIAFDCRVAAGNDDICVVNADGSGFARLTSDPARDYDAAWKPDGSALAFVTTRYGADQIVLISSAGGSVTRVGLLGWGPAWSPDGTQLAVVQAYGDYPDIYDYIVTANTDGSNVRVVTEGDQPAWKPHP